MYETTNKGKMERLIGAKIPLQAKCEKGGAVRWVFDCTEEEAKEVLNPTPEKSLFGGEKKSKKKKKAEEVKK